jgi:general secretion pathway protein G
MVTVTIIALFSGLIAVTAFNVMIDSQIKAATVEVKTIDDALNLYRMRFRSFPSTTDGLGALVAKEVLKKVPEDPWGNAYVYVSPGQRNPRTFDLYSKGPDGQEETPDDVW